MNALQYLVVTLAGCAVIGTPYMLVLSARRRQKRRVLDIITSNFMLSYLALETAFPALLAAAPCPVR